MKVLDYIHELTTTFNIKYCFSSSLAIYLIYFFTPAENSCQSYNSKHTLLCMQ